MERVNGKSEFESKLRARQKGVGDEGKFDSVPKLSSYLTAVHVYAIAG